MSMFIIGTQDYSNRVVAGAYSVYNEDIYEEWTDANFKKHKNIVTTKLRGSFDMLFKTIEEYNDFLTDINANKNSSGAVLVTLKSNNRVAPNDMVTTYCWLDFKPTRNRNGLWKDYIERLTIEVEEQ